MIKIDRMLLQELDSRYNAVLQMYGEKAEEVDELKMDLHDIKQMYKQQVSQVSRPDQLAQCHFSVPFLVKFCYI